MLKEFQNIKLKSGQTAHIVEIFNGGEAYMADIYDGDGEYTTETIKPSDIASLIVEVEQPFTEAD